LSPPRWRAIFHGSSGAEAGSGEMPLKRTARLFAPAVLYALGVWLIGGSTNAGDYVPTAAAGLDKLGHFAMYGGLGFLLGRAWAATGTGPTWVIPLLLALLLGAADEWRQASLPARSAEVADWVADAVGVIAGFAAATGLARRKRQIGANERD
jgi:VanZ family protein